MKSRAVLVIVAVIALLVVAILAISLSLTPSQSNPAYAVAEDFTNLAAKGQNDAAIVLVSDPLRAYAESNCPDGSLAACVQSYAPPEWGGIISALYRRSVPEGNVQHVQLIATYQEGKGFSGVCIYNRVERIADPANDPYDGWRVTRYAGFVPCDAPGSDLTEMRQPDAPNAAPDSE